jgi:hypothetical protein
MEVGKLDGKSFWERQQVSEWWQLHKQQEGSGKERESKAASKNH